MKKKGKNVVQIPMELLQEFVMDLNPGAESYQGAKDLFIRSLKLKNVRQVSIKWYAFNLDKFISYLFDNDLPTSPLKITKEQIEDYLLYCFDELGNKPETINNKLRSIKAFFNFLYKDNYLNENPVTEVNKFEEIEKIKPKYSGEQLKALFKQPDLSTYTGLRDYIIMLLMLDTGVRLSEVLSTKIEDIQYIDRIPSKIIVSNPKGKGQRVLPLSIKMQAALEHYLQVRNDNFSGFTTSYLFLNIYGQKMKPRSLQKRIKDYGTRAGISNVRVSPHTFRHTFASSWVSEGGDLFSLQDILGHTTLDVVRIYARQNDKDIKKKHDMYSPLNTQL